MVGCPQPGSDEHWAVTAQCPTPCTGRGRGANRSVRQAVPEERHLSTGPKESRTELAGRNDGAGGEERMVPHGGTEGKGKEDNGKPWEWQDSLRLETCVLETSLWLCYRERTWGAGGKRETRDHNGNAARGRVAQSKSWRYRQGTGRAGGG